MDTKDFDNVDKNPPAAPARRGLRSRRFWLVLALAAVAVACLIGCQPSLSSATGACDDPCHEPMGFYVEGFDSGDPALLATSHAAIGNDCLDCHTRTEEEQAAQEQAYTSGDFKNPLPMTKSGTRELCTGCHDEEAIIAATENYNGTARNPHHSHYDASGGLQCYSCHRVHRESVMYCTPCHPDMGVPENWELP